MKNITHYFSDRIKCEATSSDSEEVTKKSSCDTDQRKPINNVVKKRSRVKIKIARKDSTGRECQIIESKNDEVDKTPSPFANVRTEQHVRQQSDTPKTIYSAKISQSVSNETQSSETIKIIKDVNSLDSKEIAESGKSNGNFITNNTHIVPADVSGTGISRRLISGDDNSQDSDIIAVEHTDGRKEANAFQVLMTRGKPIQYVSQEQTTDDVEAGLKKAEIKEKLKTNKEKLTVLANKKGYIKRKHAEIEEAEQIENNIQNRLKVFKGHLKKDNCDEVNVHNQDNSPSSLFHYFSKTSVDLVQKGTVSMSTITVKADVHVGEELDNNSPLTKPLRKVQSRKLIELNASVFSADEDDIQIISTEQLSPLSDAAVIKEKQKTKHSKPKWSLRIKLNEGDVINGDDCSGSSPPESKEKGIKRKTESHKTSRENVVKYNKNGQGNNPKTESNSDTVIVYSKIMDKNIQPDNMNAKRQSLSSLHSSSSERVPEDIKNIEDINSKRKSMDNLAPLFTKKYKSDPAVLAARRLFLQSDVVLNSNSNKFVEQRVPTNSFPSLPFPTISHVTQLTEQSIHEEVNYNYKIHFKSVNKHIPSLNESDYKIISDFTVNEKDPLTSIKKTHNKEDIEKVLSEIENQYPKARQLWKNISSTVKHKCSTSPKNNKARKSRHVDKKSPPSEQIDNKHLPSLNVWCCKYKPTNTTEVIGNEEAASKLRDWLNGWKSTAVRNNDNSEDEFCTSDCSMSSIMENNQVAVLLGPHGSGKSASVYAVAEELGYSVLEVNASSKRQGKKILKEFEEATKSHRVKKDNVFPFTPAMKNGTLKKIPQNSLILFEDVDIVFEEDEGFISAVYQLASNTKRPIVLTSQDVCSHLNKLAPEQNRIYFQPVSGSGALALLQLISLAESGLKVPNIYLMHLLEAGDLRKALLQLQFLLLPGISVTWQKSVVLRESLWRDMRYYLYKPAIKKKREKRKKHKPNSALQANGKCDDLRNLADDIDRISLISSLVDVEDPAMDLTHSKIQLSLSLTESTMPYHSSTDLSAEIAEWLGYATMYRKYPLNSEDGNLQDSTLIKKQLNVGVDLALSQVTPMSLDHSALSVDYLSYVRAICRIEESRAAGNSKRGNRFFHYLHGLNLPATSTKPNILAAACRMMQDKDEIVKKVHEKKTK